MKLKGEVFIGVDIGTGGVRAIAFNSKLEQLSSSYQEHTTISSREDQAEQNPHEIYSNLISCLKDVSQPYKKIMGIGFSSMLHSIMGVDEKGNPLTPLYPFTDNQGKNKIKRIKEELPTFYKKTGCPPHPMYPAVQILWLKEEKPDIFKKIKKFLSIKSFILQKLTGDLVEDSCIASGSGLLNIHKLSWDEEILNFLSLSKKNFPRVVQATEKLTIKSVSGLNNLRGVPVYPGAGDGMLCHLASGGLKEGYLSSTVGTSGALRIATHKPFLNEKESIWCYHFYKNWWVSGGAIHNGGITLRWFRDRLCREEAEKAKKEGMDIYELFDKWAGEVSPGAKDLIFLPFLAGERSPNWNPRMRACFVGLGLHHGKKEIIRSIMEGVMCRMRAVMELLKPSLPEKVEIRASGGYTKSRLWLQIQANLFKNVIKVLQEVEAASLGAAIIAMFAQGRLNSLEGFEPKIKEVITPDEEEVKLYARVYKKHIDLYRRLEGYFSGG
ncbi:MAG TPA: gluconokinase [Candidatus Aerophobetes bacterium]|uniref:Gluconokinase n=1 Tax=Aerophobetes bacterium TaxID=2030807 RepID=A0A7V0N104_UNCAE|nr:gluconokinase [Candidatus Aerophobetes bacterium]